MSGRISGRFAAVLAVSMCIAESPAHALERVTYTSGMQDTFAHHEVIGDTTRFYKSADDKNFLEVKTERIATIVAEPDAKPVVEVKEVAVVPQNPAKPTMTEMMAMFAEAANVHNVDADLLASVAKIESGFRVNARSRAGATGVMQLMPGTAKQLGVNDATRATDNIKGGTAYLDSLLKMYHDDINLALAAYNAGPAAVAKYHGVPPYSETKWYVYRVEKEFMRRVNEREAVATVAAR